jgi:hypothetical protein
MNNKYILQEQVVRGNSLVWINRAEVIQTSQENAEDSFKKAELPKSDWHQQFRVIKAKKN